MLCGMESFSSQKGKNQWYIKCHGKKYYLQRVHRCGLQLYIQHGASVGQAWPWALQKWMNRWRCCLEGEGGSLTWAQGTMCKTGVHMNATWRIWLNDLKWQRCGLSLPLLLQLVITNKQYMDGIIVLIYLQTHTHIQSKEILVFSCLQGKIKRCTYKHNVHFNN